MTANVTGTHEAELKINPHREEGTADKGKGQLRPELMMASRSTAPEASPIPGLLIYTSQCFPPLYVHVSLGWMFYHLKLIPCSFYLRTKIKAPSNSLCGANPTKLYLHREKRTEFLPGLTCGLRDRFFRPTQVSTYL